MSEQTEAFARDQQQGDGPDSREDIERATLATMSDTGKWTDAPCLCCGLPAQWRWVGLKAVAETGDETAASKEWRAKPTES